VWIWIAYAYAAWLLILTSFRAFSVPWRWTQDQILVALLGIALIVGAARWGRIWWGGGYSAVRWQWKTLWNESAALTSKRRYVWISVWIVVALLLVAFFNMEQQGGR
jgi:hypothetical protein